MIFCAFNYPVVGIEVIDLARAELWLKSRDLGGQVQHGDSQGPYYGFFLRGFEAVDDFRRPQCS